MVKGFLLVFLLNICLVCSGDMVYLKNGREFEGSITGEDKKEVRIEIGTGEMVINRNLIDRIEYTAVQDAIKAIAKALRLEQEAALSSKNATKAMQAFHEALNAAFLSYKEALQHCETVEESTGLYEKAQKLSSYYQERIRFIEELFRRDGYVLYRGKYVMPAEMEKLKLKEQQRELGDQIERKLKQLEIRKELLESSIEGLKKRLAEQYSELSNTPSRGKPSLTGMQRGEALDEIREKRIQKQIDLTRGLLKAKRTQLHAVNREIEEVKRKFKCE